MQEVVIVSAIRTPIGKFGGTLKDMRAPEIGAVAIKEAVKQAGIEPKDVTEVLFGNVLQAGLGQNPARQASIYAGIPETAGAMTVNKVCGSGMKAMMVAACEIMTGSEEVIVAGGMENMDLAPYALMNGRYGMRLNDGVVKDLMVNDGLWDIYNNFHMGNTGEIIAQKYSIPRSEIDAFALRSHKLAAEAQAKGYFKSQMAPITIPQRKGPPIVFEIDEGVRADTTIEALAKLPPAFRKDGVVTAGNASQISDGAAALVMMSLDRAKSMGLKPMAKVRDFCTAGVKPELVMYAPVPGINKMLQKSGLKMTDMDLVEHNEAFASASVAIQKEFKIPDDRFNVNGGAVALGHPIGASGARIMVNLVHNLHRLDKKRGMGTICLGGGNATTMIIEKI
jgi:acetyl-CoA C-acetyltransferase